MSRPSAAADNGETVLRALRQRVARYRTGCSERGGEGRKQFVRDARAEASAPQVRRSEHGLRPRLPPQEVIARVDVVDERRQRLQGDAGTEAGGPWQWCAVGPDRAASLAR